MLKYGDPVNVTATCQLSFDGFDRRSDASLTTSVAPGTPRKRKWPHR
jgi:hypothetical protein